MLDRVSVVIVDSSGLIAQIDRGSELHEAARSLLGELRADSSVHLLVSPFGEQVGRGEDAGSGKK